MSLRLPKVKIAADPEDETERQELRSKGIVQAASGMGVLRGMIGFFTFLVAFAYRGGTDDLDLSGTGTAIGAKLHEELLGVDLGADGASAIKLGAVIAFGVLGGLTGSAISPRLRARIDEERILLGALLTTFVATLLGLWSGGISGALLVGFAVAISANAGKQAFDSIVQRDAPDANYGRSFARFETRFQLLWVIGALIPVIFTIPARLGFLILSLAAGFAGFSLIYGPSSKKDDPNFSKMNRKSLLEGLGISGEKSTSSEQTSTQPQQNKTEPQRSQEFLPFPEPDDPNGTPRLF